MTDTKIILVGNYPPDRQTSMLRFAEMMRESLVCRGIDVDLVRPEARLGRLAPNNSPLGKWIGYADKFLIFPRRLRRHLKTAQRKRRRLLVHICDHSNSMYAGCVNGIPHVVTCHDLIAVSRALELLPGPRVSITGRRLQGMIRANLSRVRQFACDSNNTRSDLLRICRVAPHKAVTILCQLNYGYRPLQPAIAWRLLRAKVEPDNRPLILHVGNQSWYKNRDGVLRIFDAVWRASEAARPRLMVVGREMDAKQRRFLDSRPCRNDVVWIPELSMEELNAAYSAADVFLFPSIYEGFGWPPVEAQACGCPVVAGNGGSLAEVLDGSALIEDWQREDLLAGHVARVLREPDLARQLKISGERNALRFQPPRMVEEYLSYYDRILAQPTEV